MSLDHLGNGVAPLPGEHGRSRVRLRGPGALVASLPHLIGFPPAESLVVIGLSGNAEGRREVRLTMRVDLADVRAALAVDRDEEEALDERAWEDADDNAWIAGRLAEIRRRRGAHPCHPQAMAGVLSRNGCTHALVVAVSDTAASPDDDPDPLDDPADGPVAETRLTFTAFGLTVVDALLVRQGRWWSYLCDSTTCCPREGTLVVDADADLLRAELAWSGEAELVLADRDQVVARVAARTDELSAAVRESLDRMSTGGEPAAESSDAVARVAGLMARTGPESDVSPEDWARLLLDLADVVVRDACLATWKGPAGKRALELWCSATRLAPLGHVAAPATMAAVIAHARGDGALAGEAVDRALADDPDYRLARYAAQALAGGIPPTLIRRSIVGASATLRARGEPVLDTYGRLLGPVPSRRRPRRPRRGPG